MDHATERNGAPNLNLEEELKETSEFPWEVPRVTGQNMANVQVDPVKHTPDDSRRRRCSRTRTFQGWLVGDDGLIGKSMQAVQVAA